MVNFDNKALEAIMLPQIINHPDVIVNTHDHLQQKGNILEDT